MPIIALDYSGAKLSMEASNDIEDAWRTKACGKEPWTVAFIESLPAGAVFWDIGANVGPYTLVAASRGLCVVAVEPAPFNVATLFRNLAMNSMADRVLLLPMALGTNCRWDWMHYQDTRSGAASHILGGTRKSTFHKQMIQVRTIDDLVPVLPLPGDQPHYIKLDVDGGELDVLQGAATFLESDWLKGILMEVRPEDSEATLRFLAERGWLPAEEWEARGVNYGRFERKA